MSLWNEMTVVEAFVVFAALHLYIFFVPPSPKLLFEEMPQVGDPTAGGTCSHPEVLSTAALTVAPVC